MKIIKLVDKEGFLKFCEKNGEIALAEVVAKHPVITVSFLAWCNLWDTGIVSPRTHATIGLRHEELQFFEEVKI